MCLYFELLFKCATTASLHFFALCLRWNCNEVTESQSVSAGMPRKFSCSAAVQTKNKYYNLTVADGEWAELRAENFEWSGHSFGDGQYLKCGNKIPRLQNLQSCAFWTTKTKLSTEEKRMADISGIPSHVPQEYKDQLQSFQSQIKILLQNHQVRFSDN